jgi:hypothetical protein
VETFQTIGNFRRFGSSLSERLPRQNSVTNAPRAEHLLFVVFLFYGTGVNSYNVTDVSLVAMTVLGFGFFFLYRKDSIDTIFWKIMVYWLLVNFFSWAFLGSAGFKMITMVGSLFKLSIGYIFIKIFRERFIIWFEKSIFILGLISIPFYLLQLKDPTILTSLPFNFVAPERLLAGDWNGIIFNFQPVHHNQNSGFAGEPGTFGYYIGFAMVFNLFLNGGKLTKRFFIFLLIGLTTISTNFYLTVLLFIAFHLYNSKGLAKYFAIFLLLPVVYLVFQLPFLGEKINEMIGITNTFTEKEIIKWTRVNRFSYFLSQLGAIIEYPLGYGINENAMLIRNLYGQVIDGTNGISRIGVRFGVFGFVFFFVVVYKFFQRLSIGFQGGFILFLIVTMYLGANPMERDYFLTAVFWMYFFVRKEDLVALQKAYQNRKKVREEKMPSFQLQ